MVYESKFFEMTETKIKEIESPVEIRLLTH